MMKNIIEMLCRQGKKAGSDGCRTDSLDKMDWDEFMDKCHKAELVIKAILDVELSRFVEEEEGRFRMAPLDNLDEEYMNLFSNPPMDKPARRGKSAYLRDAYHERIRRIVNALDIEGVNISSYVDMVLTDHLMRYEAQIDRLLQNSYNGNRKQQKQWLPS